jgi:two-component system, sensor histidine kinase
LITLPLMRMGACFGFIGFDAVSHHHYWSQTEINLLQLLAELIVNAEERREREEKIQNATLEIAQSRDSAMTLARLARDANAAKSSFVATMSHEIRTPLHVILGMTDILETSCTDPANHTYLHALRDAGKSLLHLINDILDFSRIETGNVTIAYEDFDLHKLVDSVIRGMSHLAERKGIILSSEFDYRIPRHLNGDPLRIRQILLNLLSNAVKFTERGQVKLFVEWQDAITSTQEVSVLFRVLDSGIGITANHMEHLFDPFYQVDSSSQRTQGGTGLGLTIVKNLVDLMGGAITVDSKPGRGSSFSVEITLIALKNLSDEEDNKQIDGQSQTQKIAYQNTTQDLSGMRVLLAEDNVMNQMLVRTHLRQEGCTVTIVENGLQAVEATQKQHFDIILMDCRMPVMDGLEATALIRENPENCQRTPIIALTANAQNADKEECIARGMTGFLSKPFTREELIATMLETVDNNS